MTYLNTLSRGWHGKNSQPGEPVTWPRLKSGMLRMQGGVILSGAVFSLKTVSVLTHPPIVPRSVETPLAFSGHLLSSILLCVVVFTIWKN
jgi:hypothetical protein